MNTNDDNREKDAAKGEPVPLQPIIDMGSTVVKSSRGTVYCLTIVGQVEGHTLLPDNTKTTKYEHVLPLLAALCLLMGLFPEVLLDVIGKAVIHP